ncbi:unnamed protein product [Orchesella dallaii]|uniref:Uncharacterized protein n=1 Tax=Orchesella dallaii TaxID=48710 RepID=A0ABP1RB11_9HEXA
MAEEYKALTDFETFAFHLQKCLHFFVLIYPYEYNHSKSCLVVKQERWKWVLWGLSMTLVLVFGFIQAICLIWYGFIRPHPDFGLIRIGLLFTVASLLLVNCGLHAIFVTDIALFTSGFNEILRLISRIEHSTETLYFFVVPYPYEYNHNLECVVVKKERWKWVVWGLSMTLVLVFGLTQAVCLIWYGFIRPYPGFGLVEMTLLFLLTLLLLVCWGLHMLVVKDVSLILSGFNEMIRLASRIERCKCKMYRYLLKLKYMLFFVLGIQPDQTTQEYQPDKYGIVLCLIVAGVAFIVPVGLWITLVWNVDGIYFLSESILSDPINRSRMEILMVLGIRFILLLLVGLEAARSMSFGFCCAFIVATKFVKSTNRLLLGNLALDSLIQFQIQQKLILGKLYGVFVPALYFGFFMIFWLNVFALSVFVIGINNGPTQLWYVTTGFLPMGIISELIFLPDLGRACDNCKNVVEQCQRNSNRSFSQLQTMARNIAKERARAMTPILIPYGSFYTIDFEVIKGTFLFLTTSLVLVECGLQLLALTDIAGTVSGFNEMLKLVSKIERYIKQKEGKVTCQSDIYGCLLCVTIACVVIMLPCVCCGSLIWNVDGPYFVIENMLTETAIRSRTEKLVGLICRAVILLAVSLEAARSFSFGFCCLMVLSAKFVKSTEYLLSHGLTVDYAIRFQLQQTLALIKLEMVMVPTFYFGLFVLFWTTVGLQCICLMGGNKVPTYVLYCTVLVLILFIVGQSIMLPDIGRASDNGKKVVQNCELVARRCYFQLPTTSRASTLKRAEAMIPVQIPYGRFYAVDLEFVVNYFTLILLRTVDAILIFEG